MSQISIETEKAGPTAEAADKGATETPDCHEDGGDHSHAKGHGHSHWMMIACCVPMALLAVVLLVGGAGLASLTPFVFCALMMGLMMFGMSRMHEH